MQYLRYAGRDWNVPPKATTAMIRFRLKELIADFEFRENRRLTLDEIANETDIYRSTLSRIANARGYNTTTDTLEKLCQFFKCGLDKVAEYVPSAPAEQSKQLPEKPKAKRVGGSKKLRSGR